MGQPFELPPSSPGDYSLSYPEHIVQFYSDDDMLLDGWSELLGKAIETGGCAICVATTPHLAGLAERFRQRGQDLTAGEDQDGRYFALDAAATLAAMMPEGDLDFARVSEFFGSTIAKARTAVQRSAGRIVVVGEMVALLWSEGKCEDVIRLEQLWNTLGQTSALSVHCGYPMRFFPQQENSDYFRSLCTAHSSVILPQGLPVVSSEEGLDSPEIKLNHVRAQAEMLLSGDAILPYPEWQGHYRTALLETDRIRLFHELEVAEAAVLTRLHTLQPGAENTPEGRQLLNAWSGLQMIKKHKLGLLE